MSALKVLQPILIRSKISIQVFQHFVSIFGETQEDSNWYIKASKFNILKHSVVPPKIGVKIKHSQKCREQSNGVFSCLR